MNEHLKKIQQDVDLMNKSFDEGIVDEPVVTDAPKTDPPTTDEPKTDPPTTDAPDEFKTDAPETKAPETKAPTTDAPDDRDQVIADLRAKLAEKDAPVVPKTKAPTTEAPVTFETQDFLKDLDVENLTDNTEEFNKLLNAVYQKAVTDTRSVPGIDLQSIPDMVMVATNLQKVTESFYAENKDLKPFKKIVATVFDDLVAKDSNKTFGEIIKDVAPEVRKRLELPDQVKKPLDKGKSPKLPRKKGKPGRSQDKPVLHPLRTELEEMNETLGR
jgi:hypothetical protein